MSIGPHVAMEVVADPAFLAELTQEADRIDRSQSWIVQRCLRTSLPDLEKLPAEASVLEGMKRSPLRNAIRRRSLELDLALAESPDPAVSALAAAPRGTEARTFYMPEDLHLALNREGDRLRLTSDEILWWAWERNREAIRSLPAVSG